MSVVLVRFSRGPATARAAIEGVGGKPGRATLEILDTTGRSVRRLWSGVLSCGAGTDLWWDGRDREGRRLPGGVFVVELRSGGERSRLRVVGLP